MLEFGVQNGQRETKSILRGICYYCRGTSRLDLDEQINDAVILFVERNIRYPRQAYDPYQSQLNNASTNALLCYLILLLIAFAGLVLSSTRRTQERIFSHSYMKKRNIILIFFNNRTNVPASASHRRETSDQAYYKLTPNETHTCANQFPRR